MSVRERGGGRGEGAGLRQAGAGWVSWAERGLCRAGKEKEVGEEKESWVGPAGKERERERGGLGQKQKEKERQSEKEKKMQTRSFGNKTK